VEEELENIMILGTVIRGAKKFDKIAKTTRILHQVLK